MNHIRNRYFLILDALCIVTIPFWALMMRVELVQFPTFITLDIWVFVALALGIKLMVFFKFGLYARYWRFASVDDMFSIIWAVTLSTVVLFGWVQAERYWNILPNYGLYGVPVSLPLIDGLLTFLFVGGLRFSVRVLSDKSARRQEMDRSKNALILGAGEMGVNLYRSLERDPHHLLNMVGFLDDDPRKKNVLVGGAQVLGKIADLPEIADSYDIEEVIIAMPGAPGSKVREIVELCEKARISPKTVPSLNDIIHGHVKINALRSVNIEDLLRRDPVVIDSREVQDIIQGQRVMVTGAGGSIGSELCRQIASCQPAMMILLGHGENSLYHIHQELSIHFPALELEVVVADLRDRKRLARVFADLKPDMVFHAAAHKHVPLMEANVTEAITNNVLGTRNLLSFAELHEVKRFVTISSDKAVNPTNIMGTTKRITELLVRAAGFRMNRPYVSVRFGNVLGSRGSVVPLFKRQISEGGPVTVTHEKMTRFFMTIPEATQLVLQSCKMGEPGDVFVLDMGEPVRILDLANHLIELSGKTPGVDIEVKITGLRPGEKMHEELFGGEEKPRRTDHKKIFKAPNQDLRADLDEQIDQLIESARQGDEEAVLAKLVELVPEFERA